MSDNSPGTCSAVLCFAYFKGKQKSKQSFWKLEKAFLMWNIHWKLTRNFFLDLSSKFDVSFFWNCLSMQMNVISTLSIYVLRSIYIVTLYKISSNSTKKTLF